MATYLHTVYIYPTIFPPFCLSFQFLLLWQNARTWKASWGGKGFIQRTFLHCRPSLKQSGKELKQDKDLEAGANTEAMEGAAYWLAPHGLLRLFFYKTGTTSPGWPHTQWARPSLISGQQGSQGWNHSWVVEFPYSVPPSLLLYCPPFFSLQYWKTNLGPHGHTTTEPHPQPCTCSC